MKSKIILSSIAAFSIVASLLAFYFDSSDKHYGLFYGSLMVVSMAILLFLFVTINYFALAFCIRQITKRLRKK